MDTLKQNVIYWYMFRGVVIAKIVCGHQEAFEEIRAKYFPQLPAKHWTKLGEKNAL